MESTPLIDVVGAETRCAKSDGVTRDARNAQSNTASSVIEW